MESPIRIEPASDGKASILAVRAQPGAKRAKASGAEAARAKAAGANVIGVWNGMLKIAVAAPPEKGRANAALTETLASILGLRRASVALVSGERSREKRFRIEVPPSWLRDKVAEILAGDA